MTAGHDLVVVVLAGGEGRRIGGDKPQRRLAGTRLIDHALRLAARWTDEPIVAARDLAQLGPLDIPVIADDPDIAGPLGGLAAGLDYARRAAAARLLTIPADMPFLPDDLADRLAAALDAAGGGAALGQSGGQLYPICALWEVGVKDALPGYLATGRRSLRGFADTVGFVAVEWPTAGGDRFLNINDAEDLARAEGLWRA